MNFQEAFEAMKQGQYLARQAWPEEGQDSGFVCIMPQMKNIWKIILKPVPNAGVFMCTIEDLEADDWQLVDKKHKSPVFVDPAPAIEPVA